MKPHKHWDKRTPSDLSEVSHEKPAFFRESKKDSELARLSTYGAQEKLKSRHFSDEKVKAMLLDAEAMLLSAEVMLLHAEVMLLQFQRFGRKKAEPLPTPIWGLRMAPS